MQQHQEQNQDGIRRDTPLKQGEVMDVDVYATVRVKVIGCRQDGDTAISLAERVSDAAAAHPDTWLRPVQGSLSEGEVKLTQYGDDMLTVLIDEIDGDTGEITEHHVFLGGKESEIVSEIASGTGDRQLDPASSIAAHCYATVIVRVAATAREGDTPATLADRVADAVAAKPDEWMEGRCGTLPMGLGDIEYAGYAEYVDSAVVSRVDAETGEIQECLISLVEVDADGDQDQQRPAHPAG